ncbi:unnamed protein product [Schistosoma margrebowiei]|uniref:Uncharacterized protein n=1 Tax=Schistosoma margrebowiei TaxID=48269 RepID=A0A183LEP5_9TREM|nr:unnamed protein product [Schistosoma margrebowiei]
MAFLFNVIRVLVRRLQTNYAPEILKLKKAVKAAILLMPLLGITNFIVLLPEPKHPLGFFIVSGIRRVLPTWQGFIISMIYYFMNKDIFDKTMNRHKYATNKKADTPLTCIRIVD